MILDNLTKTVTQLKGLDLYDTSYLHLRKNIYYFTIRVKNRVIRYSLKTSNKTIAILLKLRILHHLNITHQLNTIHFTLFGSKTTTIIKDIEINLLLKKLDTSILKAKTEIINQPIKSSNRTLRDFTDEFLSDKALTTSKKTMMKYKQAVEYILIFFGDRFNVECIKYKEVFLFRRFLFAVPHRWKDIPILKDKDLKLLIDSKSKLLQDLETISSNTVTEIVKKVKTIFRTFENHGYIEKSFFNNLEAIKNTSLSVKREFKPVELKALFTYLLREDKQEEYNFMMFLFYSGLRRGEALSLKVKNIDIENCFMDIEGTKTLNAKRIGVIHDDIVQMVKVQISNKNEDDYLFFNAEIMEILNKARHKDKTILEKMGLHQYNIGIRINKLIGAALGSTDKQGLDIHSLRKNYTQILYMVEGIKELELKTLIGHSTNSDISDTHYLRGKRDFNRLKMLVNKANFSAFLSDTTPN